MTDRITFSANAELNCMRIDSAFEVFACRGSAIEKLFLSAGVSQRLRNTEQGHQLH